MWTLRLSPRNKGKQHEEMARHFLEKQGLIFIAQNFAYAGGELDLIMQHGAQLVFIEVRYRKSQQYGGAAGSINAGKIHKIRNTAGLYLAKHYPKNAPACRFDVIAMSGDAQQPHIEWIRNAFE